MAVDCGGKIVQSIGYKAQVTNTSLTNRMVWPWTGKVGKEVSQKKKNPTDKRHRPSKQKNLPSTARGKLERKRKTWSKSRAETNYPRHSAPIPSGGSQRKNSAKEAHQPLRSSQLSSPAQSRAGPPSANEHTCLLKQSASMAGTSSTTDMVKSLGRFRRPGASSLGHQREKLNVLSRASCSSVKVPLLVVRVHRGRRGPTLRPQDIQRWGAVMAKSIAVGRPRKAGRKTSAGLRRALRTSSGRWGNSKPTFSRSGRRHPRSHQEKTRSRKALCRRTLCPLPCTSQRDGHRYPGWHPTWGTRCQRQIQNVRAPGVASERRVTLSTGVAASSCDPQLAASMRWLSSLWDKAKAPAEVRWQAGLRWAFNSDSAAATSPEWSIQYPASSSYQC